MKRKILITIIILTIVLTISFTITFVVFRNIKENSKGEINTSSIQYNETQNLMEEGEIDSVIEDTVIQGIVELKNKGIIYIFGGQHFGELGYEIEEYTTAYIQDEKQVCIDYLTLEKYDTDYIEEGDLIICSGDLIKKNHSLWRNVFDTKNNTIIVLKSNDYSKMKHDALIGNRDIPPVITVGNILISNEDFIYLEYDIEDDTHSDISYHFPFVEKVYITNDTEIKGDLQEGKKVKVQYEESKKNVDRLELKSIKLIE